MCQNTNGVCKPLISVNTTFHIDGKIILGLHRAITEAIVTTWMINTSQLIANSFLVRYLLQCHNRLRKLQENSPKASVALVSGLFQ